MAICPIDVGRYGSAEMRKVFEEGSRLQKLLDVEAAIAHAHAAVGNIPREGAEEIAKKANLKHVKLERCKEIERLIHHDLMAVVQTLAEACEGEGRRWVHYGVTSYDVEDCATALQLREALSIVKNDLLDLEEVLLVLTDKYRNLLMVGRTHGQYAGVITLGFKFAVWTREVARHLRRLKDVEDRVLVGKVSGVVGTGASLGKRALKVQEIALRKLGLKPVDIATQVVQRDLHAEVVSYLALLACSLDKFALEIRNLQRSEIQEIQEPFKEERQVGSSAVPAKRNPIKCEKVCSLARLMRSLVIPAYENVALWHERDLTNSANERFIIPMSFLILDEMLKTMKEVLKGLVVLPENVKRNLESARDIIFSERVMLKLVERGVERQKAHEVIRRGLVEALKKGVGLKDILLRDELVSSKLTEGELEECWDYGGYLGATQKLIDNVMRMTKEELKAFRVQY